MEDLPPMTMPTIVPTSEDFFDAGGMGAPDGVVLIVPVGVEFLSTLERLQRTSAVAMLGQQFQREYLAGNWECCQTGTAWFQNEELNSRTEIPTSMARNVLSLTRAVADYNDHRAIC